MAQHSGDPGDLTLEQALAKVDEAIRAGQPLEEIPSILKPADIAAYIARYLGEGDAEPRDQIARIVQELGTCKSVNILRRVDSIERKGGRFMKALGRRRTPGGVWFWLARERIRVMAAKEAEKSAPKAPPLEALSKRQQPQARAQPPQARPAHAEADGHAGAKPRAPGSKHGGEPGSSRTGVPASRRVPTTVEVLVSRRRP
jgi:hypothetical protein